jgi:hypothetical protein
VVIVLTVDVEGSRCRVARATRLANAGASTDPKAIIKVSSGYERV